MGIIDLIMFIYIRLRQTGDAGKKTYSKKKVLHQVKFVLTGKAKVCQQAAGELLLR